MPLNNFGHVNIGIYRGAQPDREGILTLEKLGVTKILKLNRDKEQEEDRWCSDRGIVLVSSPMPTYINTVEEVRKLVNELDLLYRQGTTYVHCEYGRDRTGLIVGAYRILREGWTFEQAETERKVYGVDGFIRVADFDSDVILKQLWEEKRCQTM